MTIAASNKAFASQRLPVTVVAVVMRIPRSIIPSLVLLSGFTLGMNNGHAQQPVLKESPFLPPASAAKPTAAAPTDLEFSGVLLAGPQTQVCITRRQAKRSSWVQVGQKADNIEVVSHDAARETVVLRVDGVTQELKLKSPAPLVGAAPIPASPPTAGAVRPLPASAATAPLIDPPPPVTVAEKEREARMLVSDLLEIGMQQRKAYEEAQRKAATESAQKASAGKSVPAPR